MPPKKVAKKAVARKKAVRKTASRRAVAPVAVTELDNRIAIVRTNLRDLVELASASGGAANEELMSQRITEQEEALRLLIEERDGASR